MWSAREKFLEILYHGQELNPGHSPTELVEATHDHSFTHIHIIHKYVYAYSYSVCVSVFCIASIYVTTLPVQVDHLATQPMAIGTTFTFIYTQYVWNWNIATTSMFHYGFFSLSAYRRISQKDLEDSIKSEMSGSLETGMLAIGK